MQETSFRNDSKQTGSSPDSHLYILQQHQGHQGQHSHHLGSKHYPVRRLQCRPQLLAGGAADFRVTQPSGCQVQQQCCGLSCSHISSSSALSKLEGFTVHLTQRVTSRCQRCARCELLTECTSHQSPDASLTRSC